MDTPLQETLPSKSFDPCARPSDENLVQCRDAQENRGYKGLEPEPDLPYPTASAETGHQRVHLHRVILNEAGESVGPDYPRLHPYDIPR